MPKEEKIEGSNFVNLTHETIELTDAKGRPILRISPSGEIAYPVVSHEESARLRFGEQEGAVVPIFRTRVLDIASLPAPCEGRYYIVGAKVKSYLSERTDVLAVDTGRGAYRKEDGTLVARSFRYVCPPEF